MFDIYLVRYINEFLVKCKSCNSTNINNKKNICCICKDNYCDECSENLLDIESFYKNKYCRICYNLLLNY